MILLIIMTMLSMIQTIILIKTNKYCVKLEIEINEMNKQFTDMTLKLKRKNKKIKELQNELGIGERKINKGLRKNN